MRYTARCKEHPLFYASKDCTLRVGFSLEFGVKQGLEQEALFGIQFQV